MAIINTLETNRNIENLRKEKEGKKKNQMEILELKNIITKIKKNKNKNKKHPKSKLKSRMEEKEGRISEPEDEQ